MELFSVETLCRLRALQVKFIDIVIAQVLKTTGAVFDGTLTLIGIVNRTKLRLTR